VRAPEPRTTIGIDVGGTKILGVTVTHGHDGVAVEDRVLLASDAGSPEVVDRCVEVVGILLDRADGSPTRGSDGDVGAVGLGLAGFVDRSGVVRSAPNSRGLVGLDVAGAVSSVVGLPVATDNDANCAAIAALTMIEPPVSDLVAVTFGTGIGGGVVIDGELVRGANGYAGEPGHMVVDPGGPLCPCGQHGCWERYASGSGLAWLAMQAVTSGVAPGLASMVEDPAELRGEHVVAGLRDGDPGASAVFDEYAGWVALGVANLVNLLDPQVVVLGGGVIANGESLVGRVRQQLLTRFPAAGEGRRVDVMAIPGGPEAGAIGAALLAGRMVDSR